MNTDRRPDPPIYELADHQVFFAFSDAQWAYDCITCGSKCCRSGMSFGTAKAEFQQIEKKYPQLPVFTQEHPSGLLMVRQVAGTCSFVRDNGRCRIHEELGVGAKPVMCRAFPINRYVLVPEERLLIVYPHSACPLRFASSSEQETVVRHRDILAQLSQDWDAVKGFAQWNGEAEAMHENVAWTRKKVADEADYVRNASQSRTNIEYLSASRLGGPFDSAFEEELERNVRRVSDFLRLDACAVLTAEDPTLRELAPRIRLYLHSRIPTGEVDFEDLFALVFSTFALLTRQVRDLRGRELALGETIAVIDGMFWPAYYLSMLGLRPYLALEDGGEQDGELEVPETTDEAVDVLERISANKDRTLFEILEEAKLSSVEKKTSTLNAMSSYLPWIRFRY